MLRELDDKVAVVTGAGSGLGAALAQGFAAAGMRVVAADIDLEAVAATATAIGEPAIAVRTDVAEAESVEALADRAFETFGRVDLLVNNAGVFQGGLCWERSLDDWRWAFGVNVWGIIHGIRSFVPRMIAQDSEGHVVNTASVAAFVAGPFSSPYVTSKCAAFALTEGLALDLAAVGSKIGASVLTPSAFDTGIAHTERVRPARYGRDETQDGKLVVGALHQRTAEGLPPDDVVGPVLEAVREDSFLIPTRPSFEAQLRSRYEALLRRELPPFSEPD